MRQVLTYVFFFLLGVTLPVFEHYQEGGDSKSCLDESSFCDEWTDRAYSPSLCLPGYELTGLARGGEQLSRLKRNYARAVELLVELASLQVGGAVTNILGFIQLKFDYFSSEISSGGK